MSSLDGKPEEPELHFQDLSQLIAAIPGLLKDSVCSSAFVGFHGGWRFEVEFGADGLVTGVKPTEPWQ
jgi:hypothetical protein